MKELRDRGVVAAVKIPTELNHADILTKCTKGVRFREVIGRIIAAGGNVHDNKKG